MYNRGCRIISFTFKNIVVNVKFKKKMIVKPSLPFNALISVFLKQHITSYDFF